MTDGGLILAMYLRLSKDDGRFGESQSIENQRKLIDGYIASRPDLMRMTAVEFVDDGFTGLNFSRPDVSRMLGMAKRGAIGCIIVKDFSRFSRDYIEAGDYLEQIFPFLGVRFISVNDRYDSAVNGSLAGDIGNAFKNLYNSYFSKDLSRKVRAGLLSKKQSGSFTASHCPYGYKRASTPGCGMDVDEEASAVVRRIFAMKIDGISTEEIARVLNTESVPSPLAYKRSCGSRIASNPMADKPLWAAGKIRSILRDVRYTGAFAYNMYESAAIGEKSSKMLPHEEWELIPGAAPEIVSSDVFEKAQPKRKSTYKSALRCRAGERPLARKLICGGCGYALLVDAKTQTCSCSRREFYDNASCVDAAVEMAEIEKALAAAIQKVFDIYSALSDAKGASERHPGIAAKAIKETQLQIRAASDRKTLLYDEYCDGKLERGEYLRLRSTEDKIIAELNAELLKLEIRQADSCGSQQPDMYERLKGLQWSGALTREITEALLCRVAVYNGNRLEFKWSFSDPHQLMPNNCG